MKSKNDGLTVMNTTSDPSDSSYPMESHFTTVNTIITNSTNSIFDDVTTGYNITPSFNATDSNTGNILSEFTSTFPEYQDVNTTTVSTPVLSFSVYTDNN